MRILKTSVVLIMLVLIFSPVNADVVTPPDTIPGCINTNPPFPDLEIWCGENVRADAAIGITNANARSGDGSLDISFTTVTSGQDKADFAYYWDPAVYPNRTLGNLSALSYDVFVDSSSTTNAILAPVFRLYVFDPGTNRVALLIWEAVYNGFPAPGGFPRDAWQSLDIFSGNFWMFVSNPGGGVVQNFGVTLNDWITGSPTGIAGDPTPINIDANTPVLGLNVGVGSGWGPVGTTFQGFVDNIQIEFGTDTIEANFEVAAIYDSVPPVNDNIVVNTNVGTSVDATIEVSNPGSADLQVSGISLTGDAQLTLSSATTFTITPAGTPQTIRITCDATAVGTFVTQIAVAYNSPASPATYTVTCNVADVTPPVDPPPPSTGNSDTAFDLSLITELPATGETPIWARIARLLFILSK